MVGIVLYVPLAVILIYAGAIATGIWGYTQLPTGFIPQQDKGYLIASIQLPDAASVERTMEVMDKLAATCPGDQRGSPYQCHFRQFIRLECLRLKFRLDVHHSRHLHRSGAPELYSDKIAATLRKNLPMRCRCLKLPF